MDIGEGTRVNISRPDAQGFNTAIGGFFGDLLQIGTQGYERYLEFSPETTQSQLDRLETPDSTDTPNNRDENASGFKVPKWAFVAGAGLAVVLLYRIVK